MDNSKRFLNAYKEIEKELKRLKPSPKYLPFKNLISEIRERNEIIHKYEQDLYEFAELRNAIVHDYVKDENGEQLILAEPNDWAVKQIEKIRQLLQTPPKIKELNLQPVFIISSTEYLSNAAVKMYENNYSQAPVSDGKQMLGVMTANTIARYLGSLFHSKEKIYRDILVGEVLNFTERKDNYQFLGIDAPLFKILDLFRDYDQKGENLDAILLTDTGTPSVDLRGIITAYDIPSIHAKIGF